MEKFKYEGGAIQESPEPDQPPEPQPNPEDYPTTQRKGTWSFSLKRESAAQPKKDKPN